VPVSASDEHRKRRAALSDQQLDLATLLTPIGGVAAGVLASEGCGAGFAVDGLPFPLDVALLGVSPAVA